MFTTVFALLATLSSPALAGTGLLTETVIEGGFECVYEQCDYVDEEGFTQSGGPNFTMLSVTPCASSIDLGLNTGTLIRESKATIAHTYADLTPTPPDDGVQADVQICFPLPGLTFCYIDPAPSCRDWTLSQPGQVNPEGYSCDDLE